MSVNSALQPIKPAPAPPHISPLSADGGLFTFEERPLHTNIELDQRPLPFGVAFNFQPDQSDIPFDWTRRPGSPAAQALVLDVIDEIERERCNGKAARRLQERHLEALATQVSAIVSNAALQALRGTVEPIYVTRSKAKLSRPSRYRPKGMTEAFPQRLDIMAKLGWIQQHTVAPRSRCGLSSTIKPGPRLLDALHAAELGLEDFTSVDAGEVILLKSKKQRGKRTLMEYTETAQTRTLRSEVQRINQALEEADLGVRDGGSLPVDLSKRRLVRSFLDGDFALGGRFGGGYWTSMSKNDRFDVLSIDGEPVVEVDYGQLHPRIAYEMAGIPAPSGDLYEIAGLEAVPRSARKLLLNTLFWDDGDRIRLPRGTRKDFQGIVGTDAVSRIKEQHPGIAHLFGSGAGGRIMGLESAAMTQALLRLIDQGITALPIHDALLAPISKTTQVKQAMIDAYRDVTGGVAQVEVKYGQHLQ